MDLKNQTMEAPPQVSSPELDAFHALVLDDVSLQAKLREPTEVEPFIAAVVEAARARGFTVAADAVRAALREQAMADLVPSARPQTGLPPDGWLPIRAFWQDRELFVRWAYFGERQLREPFFEGDARRCLFTPFNRLFRHVTPVETLPQWLAQRPHLQPSGFIFHMSRCGSTLVSQMLAALPSNIVVSEASPIDAVVQARQQWPGLSDDRQVLWLAAMLGAFGQERSGNERHYFIKLDCWHTLALPLFRRCFPAVPWVFLYRDPVEVLVSQLAMPGIQMLPRGVGPDLYGIERSYGPGSAEDYYARILAKVCDPVLRHYSEGGGLLINYRQLPDALFTHILPHFGIECSELDCTIMKGTARYDAKVPGFQFAPDSAAKQQSATPLARAAADRWLGEVYRRLEELRTQASDDGPQMRAE